MLLTSKNPDSLSKSFFLYGLNELNLATLMNRKQSRAKFNNGWVDKRDLLY